MMERMGIPKPPTKTELRALAKAAKGPRPKKEKATAPKNIEHAEMMFQMLDSPDWDMPGSRRSWFGKIAEEFGLKGSAVRWYERRWRKWWESVKDEVNMRRWPWWVPEPKMFGDKRRKK